MCDPRLKTGWVLRGLKRNGQQYQYVVLRTGGGVLMTELERALMFARRTDAEAFRDIVMGANGTTPEERAYIQKPEDGS